VQARWFACLPDAEAAIAEYEGQGQGHCGHRPRLWRYHGVRSHSVAETRRPRRRRRGRPAQMAPPPLESGYRLVVEVEALAHAEEDHGWTGLATPVAAAVCPDADILQAYQDQNTTVEPGLRWLKHPAAIAPVWLEKPERIAALARLTVLGLLVSSVIQRQGRLSLRMHDQQLPGNKGLTSTPTAAVGLALFTHIALGQLWIEGQEVEQLSGVQPHHRLVCDALGLDSSWYAVPLAKKAAGTFRPLERGLKETIHRPRPDTSDRSEATKSFPSGHTSHTAVFTTLASRNVATLPWPEASRTALQAGLIGLTIGTAWARVEAKQHFPSDVLFGAALGNFFGAFMNEAFLGLDGGVTIQPSREGVVLGLRWAW